MNRKQLDDSMVLCGPSLRAIGSHHGYMPLPHVRLAPAAPGGAGEDHEPQARVLGPPPRLARGTQAVGREQQSAHHLLPLPRGLVASAERERAQVRLPGAPAQLRRLQRRRRAREWAPVVGAF
eukprot:9486757-Pyramimonas_sp.AAC.1